MLLKSTRVTTGIIILAIVLLVPIITMELFEDGLYYPEIRISAGSDVDISFLFNGRRSEASCNATIDKISVSVATVCSACAVVKKECSTALSPAQRRTLSAEPLDNPSSRLPDGVVEYRSSDSEVAMSACMESDRQSNRVTCFAPGAPRPYTVPMARVPASSYFAAAWFGAASGIVCWLICFLLVRYQRFHAHLTLDGTEGGPQKFHAIATPRVAGIAILIGLLFTGAGLVPVEQPFSVEDYGVLILAALPAFAAGFAEDITKKVGVLPRLACTMIAAALCAWLLSAVLRSLDIPVLDAMFISTPFAIAFTVFAVGGVANAINIIDGYNGLVGGYSILVLGAIAWVAAQVGDMFIFTAALTMAGTLVGFVLWNYPKGKIFLGDGGAYLLGFWLAELSVLLVARHDEVSSWFPLALLVYPVFETVFSVYRRKIVRGSSPGQPDALHFHQLVYMRLARVAIGSKDAARRTHRNSMVAVYICTGSAIFTVMTTFYWRSTPVLVGLIIAFCCGYVWLYRRLVHLRAPAWLISTSERSVVRFVGR